MTRKFFAVGLSRALLVTLGMIGANAAGGTSDDLEAVEKKVLDLTNRERVKAGLAALKSDDRLGRAAHKYAGVMASKEEMGHTVDGTTPEGRIEAEGYQWSGYGENVAYGYTSAEDVLRGWMDSPLHRQNILNEHFIDLGVGVARSAHNTLYFCQDFGRPLSRALRGPGARKGRGMSSITGSREK